MYNTVININISKSLCLLKESQLSTLINLGDSLKVCGDCHCFIIESGLLILECHVHIIHTPIYNYSHLLKNWQLVFVHLRAFIIQIFSRNIRLFILRFGT